MAKKKRSKLSKDSQMIEQLIKNPYGVPGMPDMATVNQILYASRKGGDRHFITASEMVSHKFGINPAAVRKWYLEKVG